MDNTSELIALQNNSKQREALKDFMIETLKEIAVTKVFAGESVVGIQEAKLLVDQLFEKLDQDYGR